MGSSPTNLVLYSLALPGDVDRSDLLVQLTASVRSLRQHNQSVTVVLCAYGDLPRALRCELHQLGVHVHPRGSYAAALADLLPLGWRALARYPLLHKFLNFRSVPWSRVQRVLVLDCDTLFFADVERLFSGYLDAHVVAREEPSCRRSHYGYDPTYVDESTLDALGRSQGARVPPPFNLGAVLFDARAASWLGQHEAVFVRYAWRFLLGMALRAHDPAALTMGENEAARYLREHLAPLLEAEASAALPFPSANRWILDQVALWLTLGHCPDLRYRDFAHSDVLQNGEILTRAPNRPGCVLCHYYTQNLARVDTWLRGRSTESRTIEV
jgi:hypothetical protein